MKQREILPRIGFLGTGWIGRHRMQAIAESKDPEAEKLVQVASVLDAAYGR